MRDNEENRAPAQPAQDTGEQPAENGAPPAADGKKPRPPRGALVRRVLTLLFAAVFCVSAGMLAFLWVQGQREEEAFRDLAAVVHTSRPPEDEPAGEPASEAEQSSAPAAESGAASAVSEESGESGFDVLRALNSDFFGWLTIDGTGIDYPVMFTPENPQYYLRRDFEGSWAQSGVPFLDGAWTAGGNHYLIYGHNMDNGTMFAPLLKYRDQAYFDEHPVISFETEDGPASYRIFAAFYSQAYPENAENVFRYYYCTDLSTQEAYDSYVSQAKAASVYDTGVSPAFGQTILTLSTCSYHTEEGRFVVAAVKE